MKKALFSLLALTVALSFACAPQPTGNANRPLVVGGATYTVGINLALKAGTTDTYHFEVAPEEVTLKAGADQVQWVVTNFTDLELSDVTIDHFKGRASGNTDPFKNGGKFTYPSVPQHSAQGDLRTGTSDIFDTFDYQISGMLTLKDGKKVPVNLDPRVIISGAKPR
jgi:hypothetical protein